MSHLRRMIPLLALLTICMVVGHDLLMAADAHQHTGPAAVHASMPAGEHDLHADPMVVACGGLGAVRHEGLTFTGLDGLAATLPAVPFALADAPGFLARWDLAPVDPPDIRRAFLQVFLN